MIEKLENRKWKVRKSEYIARDGIWLTVRKEEVELPNGYVIPSWYVLEFPNWINVIALTEDGRFVLIDQYRHALGETHYELVAGVVDESDASPLVAAQRELLEETGFGGGEWSEFMTLAPNPTNQNNLSYSFVARGVKKISSQHLEASEDIRVHLLTMEEMRTLLREGGIIQALHAAPLWKFLAENQDNKT